MRKRKRKTLPLSVWSRRTEQEAKRRHREGGGPTIVLRARMVPGYAYKSFEYLNVGRTGSGEALYFTYGGYFGPFLFVGLRAKSFCFFFAHVAGCVL